MAGSGTVPPYLDSLNEAQRAAVETLDGPVLVLAGAGTGKTRVLTTRLTHLLHQGRARPYQMLAVTFTNKAAREMRTRIEHHIGGAVEGLWLGTFHALGARIIRRHAEVVGLRTDFTILDADDQIRLLKQHLQAANIDEKRWPARTLSGRIQRWKDKGLTPDKVPMGETADFANGRAATLYAEYQERLQTLNAVDFGDLLLHCLTVFTKVPDILRDYQNLFRYILVDEYQDTNVAQYLWLRLLAQGHKNICCVGDDDQSIYGWRGAEIGNILKFEKDFPGAQVVRLERNYRSTPQILAAASGLISNNESRLGKTLWTKANRGEKLTIRGVWDGEAEARVVGEEVEALNSKGASLNEIAILVRASFQTREFEERFITLGVPYRVVGGPRFYEREEIRDAIAYLRVVRQPDDDLALERIINKPARGIGKTTLQTLHGIARSTRRSLYSTALDILATDELRPQAKRALATIIDDFERWRRMSEVSHHTELAETVLDEAGYTDMWQARIKKQADASGRLENLKELISAMEEFESLSEFMEHVSLVMENAESRHEEMVSLMTLHSAKGLEFDVVFLPGWEEGLFPHQRALDESGMPGLEEERRLAYVGITRARERIDISHAANRRIHNLWQASIPSRFISELPANQVEMTSEVGEYGGYAGLAENGEDWSSNVSIGGPGWQRFQRRRNQATKIEGTVLPVEADEEFQPANRCFHQKFGMGTIEAVDGNHLTISFDKAGTKRVMAQFVTKAKAI
ncbi:MAG: UvrD-helicase domain-containing protein [Pseudomonadota bacterium]|nr:UvrD-helicase domain-containing protein [Pseudomonadota bacterium]